MQVREKAGQTLDEPVTAAEMISYLGLDDLDADPNTLMDDLIISARK